MAVTSIGKEAFKGKDIIKITIPNSVTSIGNGAFYTCTNLASVSIPTSVTSIKNSAFEGCSSLASVSIPDSVTFIDTRACSHYGKGYKCRPAK